MSVFFAEHIWLQNRAGFYTKPVVPAAREPVKWLFP